jgi:hypothetical protein
VALCNVRRVLLFDVVRPLGAGPVAQWESVRFTRGRSLVRSQPGPLTLSQASRQVGRWMSAWHPDLTTMLPESARRATNSLDASVFCRHEGEWRILQACKNVTVFPLGEESGEEDSRDDQDEQYRTGGDSCPMVDLLHFYRRPPIAT